jgi:hypothetical protein
MALLGNCSRLGPTTGDNAPCPPEDHRETVVPVANGAVISVAFADS